MAMDLSEFIKLVHKADTNDLQTCRKIIDERLRRSFRVGDKVSFDAGCRGLVFGVVKKVNPKTLKIRANNGVMWSVAPDFLRKE